MIKHLAGWAFNWIVNWVALAVFVYAIAKCRMV